MDIELGDIELDDVTAADADIVIALDRSMRVKDDDGHLHVETANISKANVCPYYGREIPNGVELGLEPDKVYMLYRDAAELEAAAKTYENKPLMMQHIAVSAESPQKYYIVGTVSNVRFRYPYLQASLAVWDKAAIDAIDNGTQEQLSCGYRYTADMTPGEHEGVKYDGVMRGLKCNHVALVETGRAGPDVIVSDEQPKEFAHMKKSTLLAAIKPFLATDADPKAIDAALVKLAKDAAGSGMGPKEIERKAEDADKDEKEAMDADKDEKEAMDADKNDAVDSDMDDMDAEDEEDCPAGPSGPRARDSKAMDSASVQSLVKRELFARDALHTARNEVEPLLGKVTFDSAAQVYGAALTKLGVDHAGIKSSKALGALYRAHVGSARPALASDAAPRAGGVKTLAEAFPHINRLSR